MDRPAPATGAPAPLTDTRELGFRIATLQSTEAGHGVYRRLGFIEAFGYEIHVGGLLA